MIRLGKLTDYGLVLLTYMARSPQPAQLQRLLGTPARAHTQATAAVLPQATQERSLLDGRVTEDLGHGGSLHTARELAAESRLPLPTVSKILKQLLQSGLLVSSRGINGGYSLAREPREISVCEIIAALEGPIALTECSTNFAGVCDLEQCCPIKENQRVINRVVRGALEKLTLADLIHPLRLTTIQDASGKLIPTIVSGRIQ
jgi:FeS assembly SUF system regulator